jgi:hypothetical protein
MTRHLSRYQGSRLSDSFLAPGVVDLRVRLAFVATCWLMYGEPNEVRNFEDSFSRPDENKLSKQESPGTQQSSALKRTDIFGEAIKFWYQYRRDVVTHQPVSSGDRFSRT